MVKKKSSKDAKTSGKNIDSEQGSVNSKYLFTNEFSIVKEKLITLWWRIWPRPPSPRE